jgi:3-methylcrotonyl-CoA carboxylase alpha subunit
MTLSSLLRITPRLVPTAARRTTRAASSVSGTQGNKTLDSILIANRGEIALYVLPSLSIGLRLELRGY